MMFELSSFDFWEKHLICSDKKDKEKCGNINDKISGAKNIKIWATETEFGKNFYEKLI